MTGGTGIVGRMLDNHFDDYAGSEILTIGDIRPIPEEEQKVGRRYGIVDLSDQEGMTGPRDELVDAVIGMNRIVHLAIVSPSVFERDEETKKARELYCQLLEYLKTPVTPGLLRAIAGMATERGVSEAREHWNTMHGESLGIMTDDLIRSIAEYGIHVGKSLHASKEWDLQSEHRNVLLVQNLLEAVVIAAERKYQETREKTTVRFVYASSLSVQEGNGIGMLEGAERITEQTPTEPQSGYGWSKQFIEEMVAEYTAIYHRNHPVLTIEGVGIRLMHPETSENWDDLVARGVRSHGYTHEADVGKVFWGAAFQDIESIYPEDASGLHELFNCSMRYYEGPIDVSKTEAAFGRLEYSLCRRHNPSGCCSGFGIVD